MSTCLDERELTRLYVADGGEMPAARTHLEGCAGCAARYAELARESRLIAAAIAAAAASGATMREYSAAERAGKIAWRGRPPTRTAGWFAGATVFGAAAAVAAMMALGWRPAAPARVAMAAAARTIAAAPVSYASEPRYRMMSDPISAIAYGEAASAASGSGDAAFTNYGGAGYYGDLLFCTPGDDSELCATSADRG